MTTLDRITFAWWNTGLSPITRSRRTDDDIKTAKGIVSTLFSEFGVDFLGLAEISADDLHQLMSEIDSNRYSSFDGTLREGKAQFDTGAIYDTQKIMLKDHAVKFTRLGNKRLKLLNQLDIQVRNDPALFHVLLLHWPSPIAPDIESARIAHGGELRAWLEAIRSQYNGDARIVVMGDFNAEPFQEPLSQLMATRDRHRAIAYPTLLYNPFWRHLGETHPYVYGDRKESRAGTCFLSQGHLTQWKTVDQIIVSSSFLGNGAWHLNESLTQVLHLTPKGINRANAVGIFDHFPIVTVIERYADKKGESNG